MRNLNHFTGLITRMLLLAGATLVAPACSKQDAVEPTLESSAGAAAKADKPDKSEKTQTFYGPAVPLGQGVGRAWVMVDAAKKPISIGVDLSAKSMLNQGAETVDYTFELPHQVAIPPYDHIELGWNPNGHEPEGVYTFPHFDLHFYMISSALQATIPFLAPPATDTQPAAQYLAPLYLLTPGLVPDMGAHAIDLLAPEFHGARFTKTFIYGFYQGHLSFLEPMFTLAYLQALETSTLQPLPTPIRQPLAFERAGYYPTEYTISYDRTPQQFHFSLDNLTYHQAQ